MTTTASQRMQLYRHPRRYCRPRRTTASTISTTTSTTTTARIMNYLHAKYWLFWLLCCIQHLTTTTTNGEIILRVDPLALLSATLRTYQKAACDTDQVVIACPRGTSISIEFAQYNKFIAKDGISIEELCPANSDGAQIRSKSKHLLRGSTFGSPTQKVPANRYVNGGYGLPTNYAVETTSTSAGAATATASNGTDSSDDNSPENCMWPNALQYSLLQTVVEACQKKKHCKFNGSPQYYGLGASGVGDSSGTSSYHSSTASSSAISVDPCPKRRKIVEIAYKCRPYEFRSKVACHNDVAQLECNPYSRIAVYSASFGRTEYESIQCPQPQGVKEETCLASYATETVMQICHGRRRCNLAADANTFGSPCQKNSRMYLKVVYTCVPKQVLKDRYESDIEPDEPEDFEGDFNELYDDELFYKESEAIPKLYSNTTASAAHNNATNTVTTNYGINGSMPFEAEDGVNPVMTHSSDLSLEDDQERLYLYLLIAGSVGVILCIVIVAARLFVQKRNAAGTDTHSSSSVKGAGCGGGTGDGTGAETTIPNGFNDTISEIDADIDLTTPIPVPSVSKNENYIAYGPSSSLYGSLGPSNISHTSSTMLLQTGAGAGAPTGLIANPLMCGPRQSPDIIGISNTYVGSSSADPNAQLESMMTPAIVIGSGIAICSSSGGTSNSNAIGTMVPMTSLAQYTTAPTFRAGYLINPDGVLQRPTHSQTPPTTLPSNSMYNSQHQLQQHQLPHSQLSSHVLANATLRRPAKVSGAPLPVLQQQSSYDGTAPRTLPTGLPANSQFYYG